MEYGKQPQGMWDAADGTDCSMLPHFDWQKNGFRMQTTLIDQVRGVDAENDNGYAPESDSRVRQYMNAPFSDGAVDPTMMRERSDNLIGHTGGFWEGSRSPESENTQAQESGTEKKKRLRLSNKAMRRITIGTGIAAALVLFMRFFVFNVGQINVLGLDETSRGMRNEIVAMSGVHRGDNILTLDDKTIENRINQMRYVQVEAIEKQMTHTVNLHVRIRQQSMYLWHCGIIYILDNRGMVLEKYDVYQKNPENMVTPDYPQVLGLDINYCEEGSTLRLNNDTQLSVYMNFARELTVMKMTDMVREIYLNDVNSIYLGTANGFSVRMGDSSRIHAKLRALQLVMEYLEREGQPVGTIDISNPESPTYIPTASL